MDTLNLIWPLKYIKVNQKFGEKAQVYTDLGLLGHDGIDLFALDGTPVYASHDGRVTFAGYDSNKGLGIKIRTEETHEYKSREVYPETLYWHLKTGSLLVTASEKVYKGQLIAYADNTGLSTGSHLHFALHMLLRSPNLVDFTPLDADNGYHGFIDPMPFLPILPEYGTELKQGDTGLEVQKVQAFLIRNGFLSPLNKEEFGIYGPKTRSAVFMFQQKFVSMTWYESSVLKGSRIGPKTLLVLNNYKE